MQAAQPEEPPGPGSAFPVPKPELPGNEASSAAAHFGLPGAEQSVGRGRL